MKKIYSLKRISLWFFLNSEQEILRGEVDSLQTVRSRLQSRLISTISLKISKRFFLFRMTDIEEELRKTREELEKKKEEEVSRFNGMQ
jgi:hypothetical protein